MSKTFVLTYFWPLLKNNEIYAYSDEILGYLDRFYIRPELLCEKIYPPGFSKTNELKKHGSKGIIYP